MKKISPLLLALTICLGLFAQKATTDTHKEEFETFKANQEIKKYRSDSANTKENLDSTGDELDERLTKFYISSLDHRQAVFAWQLFASKLIFVVVMLIVISGLLLSYLHFAKSLKPGATDANTNLEMSTSGIKMNSSVIGLIILVLAIAFLYLYLIHVFPINELNIDTKAVPELAK